MKAKNSKNIALKVSAKFEGSPEAFFINKNGNWCAKKPINNFGNWSERLPVLLHEEVYRIRRESVNNNEFILKKETLQPSDSEYWEYVAKKLTLDKKLSPNARFQPVKSSSKLTGVVLPLPKNPIKPHLYPSSTISEFIEKEISIKCICRRNINIQLKECPNCGINNPIHILFDNYKSTYTNYLSALFDKLPVKIFSNRIDTVNTHLDKVIKNAASIIPYSSKKKWKQKDRFKLRDFFRKNLNQLSPTDLVKKQRELLSSLESDISKQYELFLSKEYNSVGIPYEPSSIRVNNDYKEALMKMYLGTLSPSITSLKDISISYTKLIAKFQPVNKMLSRPDPSKWKIAFDVARSIVMPLGGVYRAIRGVVKDKKEAENYISFVEAFKSYRNLCASKLSSAKKEQLNRGKEIERRLKFEAAVLIHLSLLFSYSEIDNFNKRKQFAAQVVDFIESNHSSLIQRFLRWCASHKIVLLISVAIFIILTSILLLM